MKNLNGKRALLTGASRGIGPFIAEQLSAAGCNLILTARDKEALESVAERYSNKDIQITVITSDMADKNSLKQMVTEATKSSQPIDILINNAGVYECGNFESILDFGIWLESHGPSTIWLWHKQPLLFP